jgi:hypothetical protein
MRLDTKIKYTRFRAWKCIMKYTLPKVLVRLVKEAKSAYEDEQAQKAASDRAIGHVRKKICRGFDPA